MCCIQIYVQRIELGKQKIRIIANIFTDYSRPYIHLWCSVTCQIFSTALLTSCLPTATIGAIDVSVATMAEEEHLQTGEVYTIEFVPSYDLPDARPNCIDLFL